MFKIILNKKQIQAADSFTIKNEPISSINLMERAANAFIDQIEKQLQAEGNQIAVICGVGNNGGDGLAIARILQNRGIHCDPILIQFSTKLSNDCQINLERLQEVSIIDDFSQLPDLNNYTLIIDGLFGSGINKPVTGFPGQVIREMNNASGQVYSIDLPSGLYADTLNESGEIVQADLVISFQRPKISFFFPENSAYIKAWQYVDIGLDEDFIQAQKSNYLILDDDVKGLLKKRNRFSHKGTYGHALMIAGSFGKIGAAVLATKACLRSGVGLCSAYVPNCAYEIMQSSSPEAMCLVDKSDSHLSILPELGTYSSIGLGPGIGQNKDTLEFLEKILTQESPPLILDADALNLIAANSSLLAYIPKGSILTPHIKEFDRLVGESKNSDERFAKQKYFSSTYECIVVLKNAHTSISTPDGHLYFNTSGNPGMATGGSGDVLTGLITGLRAQGYDPLEAALIGVYFHGLAGDKAANERGQTAMIASDIIECFYFKD